MANLEYGSRREILYACDNPEQFCNEQAEQLLSTQPLKHTRCEMIGDLYGQLHLRYANEFIRYYDTHKFAPVLPKEAGLILNCVMLGCGLGYQLAALYSRIEVMNLILIEPNEDFFYASLHAFDWAPLLDYLKENDFHLHFFLGMPSDELFLAMNDLYDAEGKFLAGASWSYVHYASPEIRATAKALLEHNFQHSAMLGYFDDHLFATSQGVHALEQHYHFVRADRELPSRYREAPLWVIANGPSLDQDIAFLRRHQDRAVILACGTAFETLYHAGIQPDFYGCTERVYHVADTIRIIPDQDYVRSTIIVGGEVIHPETLACFEHHALFLKPEEPLYTLIMQKMPQLSQIRPLLMSNPLVGNLGLAVGVTLGFKHIYLFGLDNGRKLDSRQMHSEYNKFYRQGGGYDQGGVYALEDVVPGNFGGQCVSGKYFKLSLGSLSYLVNYARESCEVINCSDGALIEGTLSVHSQDLETKFRKLELIDKKALHDFVNEQLTCAYDFDEKYFLKLIDVPLFEKTVDRLQSLFARPLATVMEHARRMREAINLLYRLDCEGKRFLSDHLRGSLDNLFIVMAGVICSCKGQEGAEHLNLLSEILCGYLTDLRPLYAKQPHYAMGEHQQYFDKLLGHDYPHSKAPPLPHRISFIAKDYQDPQQSFVKLYE
ncbi:MAG: DUF115 domain-containing protein [Succinivibrio sp.]|nr:DUF115 domain-containing protein [Succinivibrio sp.]